MTHDEARELIGADPEQASEELLAHLRTCAQCQAYREQMIAFNAKLRRALELDWQQTRKGAPPGGASGGPLPASVAKVGVGSTTAPLAAAIDPPTVQGERSNVTAFRRKARAPVAKHTRPRLFAFAASVAAALLVGGTLWLSRPAGSLAAEIVTHVEGEPDSWHQTQPVSPDKLAAVLRKSGVRLGDGMDPVVYASSCWFRGHFVPHVVVTTKRGPVTVMILLHEQISTRQPFSEDGFSGLLVPARTGSVAVLSRGPMDLEQPAGDVVHALQAAQ